MKRLFILIILSVTVFLSENTYAQGRYSGISGRAYGNSFGASGGNYLERGYRGMTEVGNGFGYSELFYSFDVSTTHGYQFNRWFFVGGMFRIGFPELEDIALSLAADTRVYFSDRRVSPFVGAQLGITLWSIDGGLIPYVSGSVGVRVAVGRKRALNFSTSADITGVLFRLGFEW